MEPTVYSSTGIYDYTLQTVCPSNFWLFETLHTIAPMHACYHYLITNFFNTEAAQQGVWSLNVSPTLATVCLLSAEGFFARRVSLIGTKSSIVALISMLCLLANSSNTTSLAMSVVLTAKAFATNNIQDFDRETRNITGVDLLLGALADYLLSGTMILALRRIKDQHARASRAEVATIYLLNTGSYYVITGEHDMNELRDLRFSYRDAAMDGHHNGTQYSRRRHRIAPHHQEQAFVFPYKLYWAPFGLIATKLYGVTLLSVLNSRKQMASQGITIFDGAYRPNVIARAHRLATLERYNVPQDENKDVLPVINVNITEEREEHGGNDYGSYLSSTSNFRKPMSP
ncbi:hypothetical protein ONZ51_g5952 [Trametes cubensis]|uniref:Uncharacterized protein n=1 Tax=Trametes cubensis TaxID=1111947 RepID=A0AAD7XBL0_9APHY|nr:hypothetical protein ONZ51_g5952 [Trametes cubensis]